MNTHRTVPSPSSPRASKPRRRLRLAAATVAALAIVAAACGNDSSGAGTIDAIDVTTPADGTTVGESFELDVDTGEPIGEPDTGSQHLHLYYDVEPGAEDYDIVYDLPFTTRELSPGEHSIHVAVANGDHSLTDVRDDITVTVDAGAGPPAGNDRDGGGSPPAPDSSDDPDLPGY